MQAQAIRFTNDSEYRAEAVYLANSLISQMWTENQALLQSKYRSPSGSEYVNFRDNKVAPALKGAMTTDPEVLVDDAYAARGAVENQQRRDRSPSSGSCPANRCNTATRLPA